MKIRVDFTNVRDFPRPIAEDAHGHDALEFALSYAQRGLPVLPLWGVRAGKCACRRSNCSSPAKHPIGTLVPRGEKDATTDKPTIRRWFEKFPDANVGIVLRGDYVVLDVDGPEGQRSLRKMNLNLETTHVRTGRGDHYYFRGEATTKLSFRPGLDLKASGYVVAPPSRHISGRRYEWIRPLEAACSTPPELTRHSKVSGSAVRSDSTSFSEGGRNASLTRIAGALRRQGLTELDITSIMMAANEDLCDPPLPLKEVRRIAKSISAYPTLNSGASFADMSAVVKKVTEFLWTPRIPIGFLTMIDGKPGLGKSLLLADLAARVSTGRALPFSSDATSGRVLFLSVEDPAEQVMKPRLDQLRADSTKIRYADRAFVLDVEGLSALEAELIQYHPKLVVIDPLFAYLGGNVDAYRANEIMPFMYRLDHLARTYGCAIVGVRHQTKAGSDDPLYSGIGSVGFIGAVRSALMLVNHPQQENVIVLAHIKHNLSAEAPAVFIEKVGGSTIRPPNISYLREEKVSDDFLMARSHAEVGRDPKERRAAEEFVRAELMGKELPSATLFGRAEARAISEKTLRRALYELGAKAKGRGPTTKWTLK